MEFSEVIRKRRSIRKYESAPIPDEDITRFIEAAITAPSGCNSQCWYFIALKGPERINALARVVEDYIDRFHQGELALPQTSMEARKKSLTFFRKAPVVILVFLTELTYYDSRISELYEKKGYSYREVMDMLGYPDVLSVGAAIENLLLAVEDMGYGACWMNDPVLAEEDIKRFVNVPETFRLISLIPVGRPAYTPRGKRMKPLEEVFRIIE